MIYILTVRPMLERRAVKDILEAGVAAFAPMVRRKRFVHDKPYPHDRPLIPGYLFLSSEDLASDFYAIRHCRHVTGIIRRDDKPATIPPEFVARMLVFQCFGALDYSQDRKPKMTVGQAVRIIAGEFQGVLASITKIGPNKATINIGKGVFKGPMSIDYEKLEAA